MTDDQDDFIELEFDGPAEASTLESLPGVRDVTVDGRRAMLSFGGKMAALLDAVAHHYRVVDVNTREADLEEIFLTYYRDDAEEGRAHPAATVA